ncbi:3-methyladenine DNA glycosylase [Leucobacter sp. GX24907]
MSAPAQIPPGILPEEQPLLAEEQLALPEKPLTLPEEQWREQERGHLARAEALTAEHRARAARRERHPIEDFLFTYYRMTPGELARWHPGPGVLLRAGAERQDWKFYRVDASGNARVDVSAFFARRAGTVDYVADLLSATRDRPPSLGCFGLHEWAMIYRLGPEQVRHVGLPLRLGHALSDRIVEEHPVVCSHFDAFRFFTPSARPRNELHPTRENQPSLEQPGCLHAGMDIYKWCGKLGPIIPGELLLDAFELARDIRRVDMRASPYDVRGYGLDAIPIETSDGKRHYARLQADFAERGNGLRDRALDAIERARAELSR